jgi:hypothetical protein
MGGRKVERDCKKDLGWKKESGRIRKWRGWKSERSGKQKEEGGLGTKSTEERRWGKGEELECRGSWRKRQRKMSV